MFLLTRFFLANQQMLAKFAEDDRIEQMNAQKRRMRQLEHKRAVEKLIEERREQFRRERVRISYALHDCPFALVFLINQCVYVCFTGS